MVHLKPKTESLDFVDGLDAKFSDMRGQAEVPEGFGILLAIGDPPSDEVFQGLGFLLIRVMTLQQNPAVGHDGIGILARRIGKKPTEICRHVILGSGQGGLAGRG